MNSLSKQRVSETKKTKKWYRENADAIINMSKFSTYDGSRKNVINRDLYNSILDITDLTYVTNPYNSKKDWKFPGKLRAYNIIRDKISVLIGEELKRPFNFTAVVANQTAVSEKMDREIEKYREFLMPYITGLNPDLKEEEIAQKLQYLSEYSVKDAREIFANESLKFNILNTDLEEKFNKNFLEYLLVGKEVYRVSSDNADPIVRVVDVDNFDCERNRESEYLDSYDWAVEQRYLTPSDILDEFGHMLKEAEADKIEDLRSGYRSSSFTSMNHLVILNDNRSKSIGEVGNLIAVYTCVWKGQKRIGILRYMDDNGEMQELLIEAPYAIDKEMDVTVEWKWVDVWYECNKIGDDIYVGCKELIPFYDSIDNMVIPSGPYVGILEDYSLVDIMKPYEYLYDIFMFRMENAFAKAKDKALLMDITQIPRSYGMDVDKWMYYLDTLGIAFVNPMEEGVGKFQGQKSAFNQFQAIDLSLASSINSYIQVLDKIDNMCRMLVGIPLQRTGAVSQYELVGNVERVMIQSSNITELIFYKHNQVKKRVLEKLLDVSKVAWSKGKKAQYALSDLSIASLNIDGPTFTSAYYAVFVSNSTKAFKDMQTIKDLAQAAVSTGKATLSDMAKILQSDSLSQMNVRLEAAENRAMEAQNQAQKDQLEAQMAQHQEEMDLKREETLAGVGNNIRDNETKIDVKIIDSGDKTRAERANESLERQKMENDLKLEKIKARNKPAQKK